MIINFKNQDFINASKALITVCLTLVIIYSFLPFISIYLALYTAACCAYMQAGEKKSAQLLSMLIGGATFVILLAFGLQIKNHIILANTALVILAFAAFYLPNLGITYKLPPVLALVFYVSVINMHTESCPFWLTLLGTTIGAVIAILIYFLFWPYEPKHELTLIAQNIVQHYRVVLERSFLILRTTRDSKRKDQQKHIEESLEESTQLLILYEKRNEATSLKKNEADYFDALYLNLYSLLQVNMMMTSRFPTAFSVEKRLISQNLFRDLVKHLIEIETHFNQMVPHSLIAKQLIGKSFSLGKALTYPLLGIKKKSKKACLTEAEYNALLEQLISDTKAPTQQFTFALLRLRELLKQLQLHQQATHFNHTHFKQGLFL